MAVNAIYRFFEPKKDKASPYSITLRRVPELIPVLGSQSAGDVNHKQLHQQPLRGLLPTLAKGPCHPKMPEVTRSPCQPKILVCSSTQNVQFKVICSLQS